MPTSEADDIDTPQSPTQIQIKVITKETAKLILPDAKYNNLTLTCRDFNQVTLLQDEVYMHSGILSACMIIQRQHD